MCGLEPGLPGGTFPSCARLRGCGLRRQQTAHTLVFLTGDGFLGFSMSCSQPARRSQIVICNHFWPHRQRQQPARAAAAPHMGLAAPPPRTCGQALGAASSSGTGAGGGDMAMPQQRPLSVPVLCRPLHAAEPKPRERRRGRGRKPDRRWRKWAQIKIGSAEGTRGVRAQPPSPWWDPGHGGDIQGP